LNLEFFISFYSSTSFKEYNLKRREKINKLNEERYTHIGEGESVIEVFE
jgi:hypothetical protein